MTFQKSNGAFPNPHAGPRDVKRTEMTRVKKIVRTHKDETKPGIHHFQILDTVEGRRRWRLRRHCGEVMKKK